MKHNKNPLEVIESTPDGFAVVPGVDKMDFLVPEFMVPMVDHVRETRTQKSAFEVGLQDGGVNTIRCFPESSTNVSIVWQLAGSIP